MKTFICVMSAKSRHTVKLGYNKLGYKKHSVIKHNNIYLVGSGHC